MYHVVSYTRIITLWSTFNIYIFHFTFHYNIKQKQKDHACFVQLLSKLSTEV